MKDVVIRPSYFMPVWYGVYGTIVFSIIAFINIELLITTKDMHKVLWIGIGISGIAFSWYLYKTFMKNSCVKINQYSMKIVSMWGKETEIKQNNVLKGVLDKSINENNPVITIHYFDKNNKKKKKKIMCYSNEAYTITNLLYEQKIPLYTVKGEKLEYTIHSREIKVLEEENIGEEVKNAHLFFENQLCEYKQRFSEIGIILKYEIIPYPSIINKNGKFCRIQFEDAKQHKMYESSMQYAIYMYRLFKLRLYNYQEVFEKSGRPLLDEMLENRQRR